MYQYIFNCCKAWVFEKETYDEDATDWTCDECGKQLGKEQLHKISKKEGDTYKVLYDKRREG